MKKMLLVENRNHVWRDLSRLVDVECKILVCSLTQAFFSEKLFVNMDSVTRKCCWWRTGTMSGGISSG